MKMTKRSKKKNALISALMMLVLVLGVTAVNAYFTSTDDVTNTFTVGEVKIDLTEPSWEEPTDITPNQAILKDPMVSNTGVNDAFVFLKVTVPKAEVEAADLTGRKMSEGIHELFQLNAEENADWKGDTPDSSTDCYDAANWTLISCDTSGDDSDVYVFAYAADKNGSVECTALAEGDSTSALFNSVTFINATECQGLENASLDILVEAFGIQTSNLTDSDSTSPDAVWSVLSTQTPSEANGSYDSGSSK